MINLRFRGWLREVNRHSHRVRAVEQSSRGGFSFVEKDRPLTWEPNEDGLRGYGRLNGLSLNGNFLVRFDMNKAEIRSVLKSYIKSDPVAALKLCSEVQIEVIKSLKESSDKYDVIASYASGEEQR